MESTLGPLMGFALVVALIPVVLWLIKRTPLGGAAQGAPMKVVGTLPLSGTQRVLTVEVGQGEERRWLVLGVTASNIQTLHVMQPGPASTSGQPQ